MKNILTNTPVCRPLKDKLEHIRQHRPADAAFTLTLLAKLEQLPLKEWFMQGDDDMAYNRLCTYLKVPATQLDSITFGEACSLMVRDWNILAVQQPAEPDTQLTPEELEDMLFADEDEPDEIAPDDIAFDDIDAIENYYDAYDPEHELALEDDTAKFEYFCRLMTGPLRRIKANLDGLDKAIESWEKTTDRKRYPYGAYRDAYTTCENLFWLSMYDYLEAVNLILEQHSCPALNMDKVTYTYFSTSGYIQGTSRAADAYCSMLHETDYGRRWFRLLICPIDALRSAAGVGAPQV